MLFLKSCHKVLSTDLVIYVAPYWLAMSSGSLKLDLKFGYLGLILIPSNTSTPVASSRLASILSRLNAKLGIFLLDSLIGIPWRAPSCYPKIYNFICQGVCKKNIIPGWYTLALYHQIVSFVLFSSWNHVWKKFPHMTGSLRKFRIQLSSYATSPFLTKFDVRS